MRKTVRLFVFLLLLTALPAFGRGFMDERADEWIQKAYEYRGDARALPYLGSFYDIWGGAEYASFQPTLEKIAASPDSHPMVRAKAKNVLRYFLMCQDRWEEARRLSEGSGFLTSWLLIGPFPNEDKGGYSRTFEPEEKLDFSASARGTDREVTWRRVPCSNPNGILTLGNFVDPAENSTAFLATFVYSETERDAVIRCSFSGAHKIWVNRDLIAGNPAYSPSAFDQFSYPLRLSAGWNVILVKACHAKGPWAVRARLTDKAGSPLGGITSTSDTGRIAPSLRSVLKRPGAPSKGFVPYDPAAELEKSASRGGWEEQFLLGLYLLSSSNFDETEHKDADAFRAALQRDGAPRWLYYFVGEAERDQDRMREAFEKSCEGSPMAEALLRLYYYYNQRGMTLPAVKYLYRALELRPDDPYLLSQKWASLSSSLSDGLAEREEERLHEANPGNITVLHTLIWIKERNKDVTGRERLYGELLKKEYTEETVSAAADFEASRGRAGEACSLMEGYLRKMPESRGLAFKLSSLLLEMGRPAEARKTLGPFLVNAPDWSAGRELLGETFLASGDRESALNEFEKALLLNPQNDNLKRRLAYLKPDEELFYEPFRLPLQEITQPGQALKDEPVVVLLDNTFVSVEPSGLCSRFVQFVAKIQSPVGAEAMSAFPITFDPDWQEVRVLDSSVTRPDGTRLRAQSFVTSALSEAEYQLYYRNRQLVLSFSSLKKGDTVSIEYLLTDTGDENSFGRYFGDLVPFEMNSPILMKKYTLRLPDSLPVTFKAHLLAVEPSVIKAMGKTTYQWAARDIPKSRSESNSPGFGERASYLHISTFGSWEELGKWYSSFIKDQWELGKPARDTVAELVKDKRSVVDKVKAVHGWVVGQTRYVGLEFGVHGYKPYKAGQIFERRFGDCKDKAILLCSMLAEAGVEAQMVLVRTRNLGAVEKSPASLATFNHAICYVPSLDLFLDGTAEYSGISEIPSSDQGCDVLVVSRDGKAEVKTIPESSSEDNIYDASYEFDAGGPTGPVGMKGRFAIKGQEAAGVRSDFKNPERQKELLEKQLSFNYPGSKISEAEFSDMKDINSDIAISFTGSVKELMKPAGEKASTLPLWIGGGGILSRYCMLKERTSDLLMAYPFTQIYTISYRLPPGARAEVPRDARVETAFGSFERTVRAEERLVTVTAKLSLAVRRVAAADYPEFRDFSITVDKLASERMKLQW